MQLVIVTPDGKKYDGTEVEMVIIPTVQGEIGIKDDHTPLIATIEPGAIEVTLADGKVEYLAVSRGILQIDRDEVMNGRVRILADTAEHASEIDLSRAEEARLRAEEFLRQAQEGPEETPFADTQFLQAKIAKELARERVANRYKNIGGSSPISS